MIDLPPPPPPTEIVYQIPDSKSLEQVAKEIAHEFQQALYRLADHPEILENLTKEQFREFREALAYLARQAEKDASPEKKAKLEEDIRRLLSDDEEDDESLIEENITSLPIKASYSGFSPLMHSCNWKSSNNFYIHQNLASKLVTIPRNYSSDLIVYCGFWDDLGNGFKKFGKEIKKVAKEAIEFIKEHPVEILVAVAVIVTGGVMIHEKIKYNNEHFPPEDLSPPIAEGSVSSSQPEPLTLEPEKKPQIIERPVVEESVVKNVEETPICPIDIPLPEASADLKAQVSSQVAHFIWEVAGNMAIVSGKTLESLQKVNDFLGLPNNPLLEIKPGSIEKAKEALHIGHEKIDSWFETNYKNNYPIILSEETQLKIDTGSLFLSPFSDIAQAESVLLEVKEVIPIVCNKLKGLLTTEKEVLALEKVGATVQKEIDEAIAQGVAKKSYPEMESNFYEKNLNDTPRNSTCLEEVPESTIEKAEKPVSNFEKTPPRTEPKNLTEQIAMDEAKSGLGEHIMPDEIKDPRYPPEIWKKMQLTHRNPDGTNVTIHYWENKITAEREGFKFKNN